MQVVRLSAGPGPETRPDFPAAPGAAAGPGNPGVAPAANAAVAASPTGVTAGAIGNIDGDVACDEWHMNDQRRLTNDKNDVSATTKVGEAVINSRRIEREGSHRVLLPFAIGGGIG